MLFTAIGFVKALPTVRPGFRKKDPGYENTPGN